MSIRKHTFASGEYYHVYNRGNGKQTIFHDNPDYYRFCKLIFLANGDHNLKVSSTGNNIYNLDRGNRLVNIGCYCLMPNHFHILLTQPENGNISKFMQRVCTGYSMYYNIKYERSGTLFEGKFKSKHVEDEHYFKYLFSYIHLNPIKTFEPKWKEKGITNKKKALLYLQEYSFSSYLDLVDNKSTRPQKGILDQDKFPDYFSEENIFRQEVFEWLKYEKELEFQARPN